MAENFVKQIDGSYDAEANVYNSIFEQYERVVIQSLITSFGLRISIGCCGSLHFMFYLIYTFQSKYYYLLRNV